MERELSCPSCGRNKWIEDDEGSNVCDGCGSEMDLLSNGRCNVCGRELWGRDEHEIGMCFKCSDNTLE